MKFVPGRFVVSEPQETDAATECPTCGFDAVLAFPCAVISEAGVTTLPPFRACVRCHDASK